MAQKFIVRAVKPDKSVVLLADETVEFGRQKEILYANANNTDFAAVQMFRLEPHTREFHPIAAAESEAEAKANEEALKKTKSKGKSPDGSDPNKGPTVQEYLAAGYDPKNYPPQGFKSRSTPEEIKKAIEEFKSIPVAEDPEEFKGKTDAEIMAVAKDLKLELPPEIKRAEIIAAIVKSSEKIEGGKEPGFFGKLFGKK
jgi:hypothetical protein